MPVKQSGLRGVEKVVVLKGRDFSRAATGSNINVALATEGIFPRRNRLFQHLLRLFLVWTRFGPLPGQLRIYSVSCPEKVRNTHAKVENTQRRGQALP